MLKKIILTSLLGCFLFGSTECLAQRSDIMSLIDLMLLENKTFTSKSGAKGRILCSEQELKNIEARPDSDSKKVALLKCIEIQEVEDENISFKGGFHYPNFTQKSQIQVNLDDNNKVSQFYQSLASLNLSEEILKYNTVRKALIDISPQNDMTVSFLNTEDTPISKIKLKDADFSSLFLAFPEMTDDHIFNFLKDIKITHVNTLTFGDKPNAVFEGSLHLLAGYQANGSSWKFYNPDGKVIISATQQNAKTLVDMRYPKSGAKMFSFTVDTNLPIFASFAQTLKDIQTEKEYEESLTNFFGMFLFSQWKIQDMEWVDPDGRTLLKIDELFIQPASETIRGTIGYRKSDSDFFIFKVDGLNNIQIQNVSDDPISSMEMLSLMKENSAFQQVALQTFLNEIEALPPSTFAAIFYKGVLDGYNMAMARHQSNLILDYVSRCAIIAATEETKSNLCQDIMDNEKIPYITDAAFRTAGSDIIIDATIPSQDIIKPMSDRVRGSSAMKFIPGKNGAVQFIFRDVVDADAHKSSETQAKPSEKPKTSHQKVDNPIVNEIITDKTNSVLGNPDGDFVIIEFFDYNCGYCRMMNNKLAQAVKESDNIRWILIDTPIFGERSEIISKYALAAGKQGKFAEFHEAIQNATDKSENGLKAIGQTLGLDGTQLEKDAHSAEMKNKLHANRTYMQKLNAVGVPIFIINGEQVSGAFSDEKMAEYIRQANDMKKEHK